MKTQKIVQNIHISKNRNYLLILIIESIAYELPLNRYY